MQVVGCSSADAFRNDPDALTLPTPSGRIEIYSERIAGFGYAGWPGHPVWLDKPAPEAPLHLLSNQPNTRQREPLTLNPLDAHARGIVAGDVVKVFNGRGTFLAGVILSDGIRPGVVQIATGAWFDPLVVGQPGSLDKHGNPNRVTADIGASLLSQGGSAQTTAVEIVKWTEALPPVSAFEPPVLERG